MKQDLIDVTFTMNWVPKLIFICDVAHHITPSIPILKRCFKCPIYGHIDTQCQWTHPTCEHPQIIVLFTSSNSSL